jgi:hypothetical protein
MELAGQFAKELPTRWVKSDQPACADAVAHYETGIGKHGENAKRSAAEDVTG